MDLGVLQRTIFDAAYTWRIPLAVGAVAALAMVAVVAHRRGWFAAARRHPGRTSVLVVVALAVGLPMTYYLASPLVIRTTLYEPGPVVAVDGSPAPTTAPPPSDRPETSARPTASTLASLAPTAYVPTVVASGPFHGSDDFHFGEGTASIIETAPGTYVLRFEDFSVRNGPDLYVYLSPAADGYADGALEIGVLKATDGAFGYELPPGTDPAAYASAIVWCKQFSHLFATAPFEAG